MRPGKILQYQIFINIPVPPFDRDRACLAQAPARFRSSRNDPQCAVIRNASTLLHKFDAPRCGNREKKIFNQESGIAFS
jgi:hypothetical protein